MRLMMGKNEAKFMRDFNRDHYLTTGQMAKVFGVSRDYINRNKSRYVDIPHINTPRGMLWDRYQIYKYLLPKASDDVVCNAILNDRDKIQFRRSRKKGVKINA